MSKSPAEEGDASREAGAPWLMARLFYATMPAAAPDCREIAGAEAAKIRLIGPVRPHKKGPLAQACFARR